MKKIFDTHLHIWDLDKARYPWLDNDTSILHRNYSADQLEHERLNAGITKAVLVQAAGNAEDTRLMFDTAASTSWIAGVVAWLPLMDPSLTYQQLLQYKRNKYFKGVRHQIHDEPDDQWLLQPSVLESLRILSAEKIPYDIVGIKPAHIQTALAVAEKVPGLKMVLNHMNQPPIKTKERFGQWGELMKEAAKHKNFFIKISGLGTTAGNADAWTKEDIQPYIEFALEHFGEDRCFCGGDWPVALLAGSYTRTWNVYKEILGSMLSAEAQEKVFYRNATVFYDL